MISHLHVPQHKALALLLGLSPCPLASLCSPCEEWKWGLGGRPPKLKGMRVGLHQAFLFLELQVGASLEEDEGLSQFCQEPLSHFSS